MFHLNPNLAKTVYRGILKFSQMQDDEFLQNLTQFIREIFNILEDFRILVVFFKKVRNIPLTRVMKKIIEIEKK